MAFVAVFVELLTTILSFAIFIRAILSWFPNASNNTIGVILAQITDPVLVPLRRVLPTIGMIDITPLVAILLLQFINIMVASTMRPI
jgi:YggT family protein